MIGNWLYVHFGISGSGPYYGFWSGAGSDFGEVAIVAALIRLINCHEKGCWRLGFMHKGHIVCHKHRSGVA